MALELIGDLPANVLGVEAQGKVTDNDYETVLIPAVEKMMAANNKGRLLYVFGSSFDGYEAEAMWDDAKLGLKHLASWEKIAFVSDSGMYRGVVKAFGFAMAGEVRVFSLAQLGEAKSWIAG